MHQLLTSEIDIDDGSQSEGTDGSVHLYPQDLNIAAEVLVTVAEITTYKAEAYANINDISEVGSRVG